MKDEIVVDIKTVALSKQIHARTNKARLLMVLDDRHMCGLAFIFDFFLEYHAKTDRDLHRSSSFFSCSIR